MRELTDCRLYGILDTGYCAPDRMGAMLERMIAGGVDIVQLRAKGMVEERVAELTRELHPLSMAARVPFIINDHPCLAAVTEVEGIHVGVEDMSVAEARRRAGRPVWIGKSSHNLAQATGGAGQGADYLGFGPLFSTPTKPDYVPVGLHEIRQIYCSVAVPVFCIGGIKRENLRQIMAAGAERVVIVSGLLLAVDPEKYARECVRALQGLGISG